MTSTVLLTIVVIAGVLELIWLIKTYNTLQRKLQDCLESYGNLIAALEARYATITNLKITVDAFLSFESSVQTNVANLRSDSLTGGNAVKSSVDGLEAGLKSVIAVAEGNPRLVSAEAMTKFALALRTTEDNVLGARLQYNRAVASYLNVYRSLPHRFVAKGFGFIVPTFFDNKILHNDS